MKCVLLITVLVLLLLFIVVMVALALWARRILEVYPPRD